MSLRHTIRSAPARSAGLIGAAALVLAAGATVTAQAAAYQPTVLYTMSNADAAQGGNAILAFRAQSDYVIPLASFATGGDGTGSALGSQGALALAELRATFARCQRCLRHCVGLRGRQVR